MRDVLVPRDRRTRDAEFLRLSDCLLFTTDEVDDRLGAPDHDSFTWPRGSGDNKVGVLFLCWLRMPSGSGRMKVPS